MKSLQTGIGALLCILLALTIIILQMLYAAHTTFMSQEHIAGQLEKERTLRSLTNLIYTALQDGADSQSQTSLINQYSLKVLEKTDPLWFKKQITIAAGGIQQYLFTEAASLPTLYIQPFQNAIKETLLSDIMQSPKGLESKQKIKIVLSVLSNKYFSSIINFGINNQIITTLLGLAPIQSTGFDKAALVEIIRIYQSLDNNSISLEQASTLVSEQMVVNALGFDHQRDYFDMNVFVTKVFPEVDPVKSLKTLIHTMDKAGSRTAKVLSWGLLLLLFLHYKFSISQLFKALSLCLFTAASMNLIFSVSLMTAAGSSALAKLLIRPQGAFGSLGVRLMTLLLQDYGRHLLLLSFLMGAGALGVYWILRFAFKTPKSKLKKTKHLFVWRITAVAVVFLFLFCWWNYSVMSKSLQHFHKDIALLREKNYTQDVTQGLIEAGGMEFLKQLQKSN